MPVYEYRCLSCDETFERRLAADEADDVRCPQGHADTKRLLSVFAAGGRAAPPAPAGCCGGGACGYGDGYGCD